MANITLDNTPSKTVIADDAIIAIAEGDKLKHITKGALFSPYLAMINGKVSLGTMNAALALKIDTSRLGAVNGVATLNSSQKLSGGQRPSATPTELGCIMLAGDLYGTADAPTAPGKEDKSNKTRTMASPNDTEYPTTKAVADAILLGVNGSYKGNATPDMDGDDEPVNSFWTVVQPAVYPGFGNVELLPYHFGIIDKTGPDAYTLSQALISARKQNFYVESSGESVPALVSADMANADVLKIELDNNSYYINKQFTKDFASNFIHMISPYTLEPSEQYLVTIA